jgi:hypothetical protein
MKSIGGQQGSHVLRCFAALSLFGFPSKCLFRYFNAIHFQFRNKIRISFHRRMDSHGLIIDGRFETDFTRFATKQ